MPRLCEYLAPLTVTLSLVSIYLYCPTFEMLHLSYGLGSSKLHLLRLTSDVRANVSEGLSSMLMHVQPLPDLVSNAILQSHPTLRTPVSMPRLIAFTIKSTAA